jgi:hypothetical protein
MKIIKIIFACSLLLIAYACRTTDSSVLENSTEAKPERAERYTGPANEIEVEGNEEVLWLRYCKGDYKDPGVIPGPNYDEPEVAKAAGILSQMEDHSFALYYYIRRNYTKSEFKKPDENTKMSHDFLTYLCGEFRDRPTMVQAKVRWVNNTNYLPIKEQPQVDPTKHVWSQMTANSYKPYLAFSSQLFSAKKQETNKRDKLTFGKFTGVDRAIPAQTVCETNYIFAEWIDEGKAFTNMEEFTTGLKEFDEKFCTQDDRDHYYDFRGDGNFKPNSPESNGMIWHAISIALQCESTTKASVEPKYSGKQKLILKDEDCRDYFTNPFRTRWNGARAGLAAWILHDNSHDSVFSNSNANVTIKPNWGTPVDEAPHTFLTDAGPGKLRDDWKSFWQSGSMQIFELAENKEAESIQERVYERLKNAVDRHTDWYNSAYDDGMNQRRERDQAYSPFVASSYEMSESDSFTAPCYTIPCKGDVPARHWKHFMFVFKIHKDKWYTTDKLDSGAKFDFDKMWIDETSFGTTGLAKAEKAFDRLGTALEPELDSILYLHNICSNGQLESADKPCDSSGNSNGIF